MSRGAGVAGFAPELCTFSMKDQFTVAFGAAALLVIAGLYLVNRPEAARAEIAPDPNL